MNPDGGFNLSVSQNHYLSVDDDELHAIVTVTAKDLVAATGGSTPEAAEVIVIDCSGSMSHPPPKISNARAATAAAIDALRDGVHFAVVEGTHDARMVYPANLELAKATAETKGAAKSAVRHLVASGGTAMGTWLRKADELLDAHPTAIRHVTLLTDGRNESELPSELETVLRACQGKFTCDGRGIGDDYSPEELSRIVSTLRGSADAIVDYSDLPADFVAIMRAAQTKEVPDVRLRVKRMPFAQVRLVRQRHPTDVDLTEWGISVDERTIDFSTGSWGSGETREIHLCLAISHQGQAMATTIQAARLGMVLMAPGGTESTPCGEPVPILVHWTDDDALSSIMDAKVAHYLGCTELHEAIKAGWVAYQAMNGERATAEWGRAVALAATLDHMQLLRRLRRLVDIEGDPADGVVTLRENLQPRDYYSAYFESQSSSRSLGPAPQWSAPMTRDESSKTCPRCSERWGADAVYCEKCGEKFTESA